jgi:hypothetical protein
MYGSGCSPNSDMLPNGIWFGRIEQASAESVEFDLMCFGPSPGEPGNVVTVTNDSTRLRTVPVWDATLVHAIGPDGGWEPVPYSTWYPDPGREPYCPPEGCWDVWLYVNDRMITEIVQIYFQ